MQFSKPGIAGQRARLSKPASRTPEINQLEHGLTSHLSQSKGNSIYLLSDIIRQQYMARKFLNSLEKIAHVFVKKSAMFVVARHNQNGSGVNGNANKLQRLKSG